MIGESFHAAVTISINVSQGQLYVLMRARIPRFLRPGKLPSQGKWHVKIPAQEIDNQPKCSRRERSSRKWPRRCCSTASLPRGKSKRTSRIGPGLPGGCEAHEPMRGRLMRWDGTYVLPSRAGAGRSWLARWGSFSVAVSFASTKTAALGPWSKPQPHSEEARLSNFWPEIATSFLQLSLILQISETALWLFLPPIRRGSPSLRHTHTPVTHSDNTLDTPKPRSIPRSGLQAIAHPSLHPGPNMK